VSRRPPSTLRTSLFIVIVSAMLFTVYSSCTVGPLAVKFFEALGANDFHFGLLAGIPQAMVAMLFVGAIVANSLDRRKPMFMIMFVTSRLLYIPVAFLPWWFPELPVEWLMGIIITLISVNYAMTHIGSMLWQSWMADLVPHRVLNHYWGTRQRAMSFTAAACGLAIAVLVAWAPSIRQTFPLLVAIGVTAGVTDIFLFFKVDEPPHHRVRNRHVLSLLVEPIRDRAYRGFLAFQCVWYVSAGVGGAFVWVYAVKILHMPAEGLVVLLIFHGLGVAASGKLWGKLADKHGHKPIFVTCLALKSVYLFGFMASTTPQVAYHVLPIVLLLDGVLNGGLLVATNGYQMKRSPRENRPMFIAAATGLAGICGGVATAVTGWGLNQVEGWSAVWYGYMVTPYHVVFALSIIARLGCVPMALVIHEPDSTHPRQLLSDIWSMRRILRSPTGDVTGSE
jgi:MFS family permease